MAKTKVELGNALKKLAYEKSFDKISVSDITSKCNLNRQTFYYHFQDKYECLEWVYRNECLLPLTKDMNSENWEKCIEKMLIIMSENKEFYMNSIKDNPKIFMDIFISTTTSLFHNMIAMYDESKRGPLSASFISEFLTMGIIGMIMNWISKGMKVSPLVLSEQFKIMAMNMRKLKENQ